MKIAFQTVIAKSRPDTGREYRIPAIVATSRGSLLVGYEIRSGRGDWSVQQIAVRRSTDGGRTFSPPVIMAEDAASTFHNPTFIVDADRVHMLYGQNYEKIFHCISQDDGLHFTQPVEITEALTSLGAAFPFNVAATGPGHGIRLNSGRLLVPLWIANGAEHGRVREHCPSVVAALYSDDGGVCWRCGQLVPMPEGFVNPSETGAVQLEDGRVMLNLRNESRRRRRALAYSEDGGETFSEPVYAEELPDPICFGSMVKDAAGQILYVGCRSEEDRVNLTLMQGNSDGGEWRPLLTLAEKAGYADIAAIGSKVLCFYEEGGELGVEKLMVTSIEH